jgi:hypothetical protein
MKKVVKKIAKSKYAQRALSMTQKPRYLFHELMYKIRGRGKRLEAMRNKYRNEPILVIGNGPSLKKTPLDKFNEVTSIGMNKINLIFDNVEWRPDYIFVANKLVLIQNRDFYEKSGITTFVSWKDRYHIDEKENINYYLQKGSKNFSTDFSKGVGSSGTITYSCLQFAYYLGADPVILFGVDHNFDYDGEPNEVKEAEGTDTNHFDPNYFSDGDLWGLPNLELSELAYAHSRKAFESDNRQILDATIGGELDIFPKISVDKALEIVN